MSSRVTARAVRTEGGDVFVEYELSDRTYRCADEVEAALRGESWD